MIRPLRLAALLTILVVIVGSLVAYQFSKRDEAYQLRGVTNAAFDADLPYRLPRLGVNADLRQYAPTQLDDQLALMEAANIHWVRQFIDWGQIETQRGRFDWATTDAIVEAIQQTELELVVVITGAPDWATESDATNRQPDDPAWIVPFVRTLATRYGETLDYYQVYDEPNLYDAWGERDPRPAEYAALLSLVYETIHGADADATVIAAALAPTTERGPRNIADWLYLDALYELGASAYFDAVAAKPYGFDLSPDNRTVSLDVLNFSRLVALREVMQRHGDGQKALWASHWGWNALPEDWSGAPSIWGEVTPSQQQAYIQRAFQRAEDEWPWLGGMVLHHWQPNAPADDPVWGFAIRDPDGQPTALYDTLRELPIRAVATNGLYHPQNAYTEYSGVWEFSPLGADIGWLETSDSKLQFSFAGTSVSLLLRQGDYFAFLYPTINDKAPNQLPMDSNGHAYIMLRSASTNAVTELVPLARDLPDETHNLAISADRGWDQWAFAGFAVGGPDLHTPYRRTQNGLLFVATIATALLAVGFTTRLWTIPLKLQLRLRASYLVVLSLITSIALAGGMLLTWSSPDASFLRRDVSVSTFAIVISAGFVAIKPPAIVVAISVLVLFVLIYNRIEIGVGLTLFYAPFFLFPVELYQFAFPMATILVWLTFMARLLQLGADLGRRRQSTVSAFRPQIVWRMSLYDGLVLSLLLLGTASLAWAQRADVASTEWRTMILEPTLLYLVLRSLPLGAKEIMRFFVGLVAASALIALYGLFKFAMGDTITTLDGARRLISVHGSPNNEALWLERIIPFMVAGLILVNSTKWRVGITMILVPIALALLLTQSVGALLIGLPAGFAMIALLHFSGRLRWPFAIGAGLIVIGAFSMVIVLLPRMREVFDLTDGTAFLRIRLWQSTWSMLSDYPITGLGLDQFLYAYRDVYIRPDAIFDPDLSHPHNLFLDFWVRLGILGLCWIIALISIVVRDLTWWLHTHTTRSRMEQIIGMGTFAIWGTLLAHGLIDNSYFVIDLAYSMLFLLFVLAALRRNQPIVTVQSATERDNR